MHIFNKRLVLSFTVSTLFLTSLPAKTLFDEMIEEMNEMQARFERHFNRINQEAKQGLGGNITFNMEQSSISIRENKTNNTVDVIISPVSFKEKTFDATMDQDTNSLTITTPAGTATVQVDRYLISVGFNNQIKQEIDQKNNKSHVAMSSLSQTAKTVRGDMALEEARIEYDQATLTFTVIIPLRKKTYTKIPVTIKN